MMGIIIECEKNTNKYFIANPEELDDDSIGRWMLSTLTVNAALSDCAGIKNRILLENAPSGEEFLEPIINAIKTDHRLKMGYKKFNFEGYVKIVCPYALKRFQQRWYLLALNDEEKMRIYAIDDRTTMMEMTDQTFEMPEDFSPEEYFAEYFGVLTLDIPMAHVVVRAYNFTPNYLRTLPLHHSQRELESGDHYTDFSFDIRPTDDFLGKLFSYRDGIEILEPSDLREKMKQLIAKTLKRYF
jgi:predicted DNA-binding transcriptional regulator YafY